MLTKVGCIFAEEADVKVIPVNTKGVMGLGLALTFKKRHPKIYLEYRKDCKVGEFVIGVPKLYEDEGQKYLLFPTKEHYNNDSRREYLIESMRYIVNNPILEPEWTILTPALGAGCGRLDFNKVKRLIQHWSESIPNPVIFISPR